MAHPMELDDFRVNMSEDERLRDEFARMRAAALIAYGALCVLNTNGQVSELIAALEKTLFPRPDIEGGE